MFIPSKLTVRLVAFFLVGLAVVATALADEYRTWTDSTGRHKLQAKFDSVKDGKVILIRENGSKVKIALEKLSKADQDYVAERTSDGPFEKADGDSKEPAENGSEGADNSPRTVKPDWSQSQAITLLPSGTEWKVTPPSSPASDYHPKSVPLPPKRDFFEGISGMAISRVAKAAVVGYTLKRPGVRTETSVRVVLCDLQRGRTSASAETSGDNMTPIALHDDGRHILMRRNDFGGGNLDRLETWTIRGKDIVRSLKWTPYEEIGGWGHDVLWAEFLDAKRLATSSRSGRIAIWNLATCQPICHLDTCDAALPSLSADRKLLAFATNDSVGLFDIEKQEVIALQKAPRNLTWPTVAFSPSGQKIGCITADRILVWDTASGKLEKDFAVPGISIHGFIDFPSENFILANNQFLIELPNQLKLWHYQGAERIQTVGGTSFLAIVGDHRAGLLLATKLPHPEATALLRQALEQPDLFVFQKGTRVKLDVSGIPADHQDSVKEALTKKLTAMNCPAGDSGDVEVVAVVEGPTPRKVSYMHTGTYDVQEYFTKLKFVYQGQTVWESSWTNIPAVVHLPAGENMESFLRKASSSPTYQFYDDVVLPDFLQKPMGQNNPGGSQTIGASRLTPQGIR